jgi:hypothetical protein
MQDYNDEKSFRLVVEEWNRTAVAHDDEKLTLQTEAASDHHTTFVRCL